MTVESHNREAAKNIAGPERLCTKKWNLKIKNKPPAAPINLRDQHRGPGLTTKEFECPRGRLSKIRKGHLLDMRCAVIEAMLCFHFSLCCTAI